MPADHDENHRKGREPNQPALISVVNTGKGPGNQSVCQQRCRDGREKAGRKCIAATDGLYKQPRHEQQRQY
jgi:hypothetical protein